MRCIHCSLEIDSLTADRQDVVCTCGWRYKLGAVWNVNGDYGRVKLVLVFPEDYVDEPKYHALWHRNDRQWYLLDDDIQKNI